MAKTYNITVNGTTYAVEVEETGSTQGAPVSAAPAPASPSPAAPAPAAAAPAAEAAPAPVATSAPSADAYKIESPMPGTILDIKVTPGQAVAEGDVLLILEAMKMENEIVAPQAGTVDAIVAAKGSSVNAGDILISLK
ncbi:MAG: biotin/lipoyl-binding protein [Clostridiales Family XIII bacterium]|jgi:biotin carboxyl carrier protein|nr:biotin/lipoyl-binding protein [Clostridiales Family XIII bacterium]